MSCLDIDRYVNCLWFDSLIFPLFDFTNFEIMWLIKFWKLNRTQGNKLWCDILYLYFFFKSIYMSVSCLRESIFLVLMISCFLAVVWSPMASRKMSESSLKIFLVSIILRCELQTYIIIWFILTLQMASLFCLNFSGVNKNTNSKNANKFVYVSSKKEIKVCSILIRWDSQHWSIQDGIKI